MLRGLMFRLMSNKNALSGVLSGLLLMGTVVSADDLEGKIVTEIRIQGLQHTKEYVVRRELASRVGEPYTRATVEKDKNRLDRLRLFSAIDVRPVAKESGVEIRISVREILPYLPTVSVQVNDENGLSIGPGVKSLNFLGRGIELGGSVQFGGSTNVEASVRNPWVAGNHVSYQVQYFRRDRRNELDDFHEIANEPDVRVGSFIGERGRIGVRAGLRSIHSDRDGVTLSPDHTDNIPSVGVFLGYDTRDIWSNPGRGWWNEFEIGRSNVLGTEGDYWTYVFDVRRYDTWEERHTLMLTSLTTIQTGRVGIDIPLHQDFHIGGTNTIRGWSLDSRSGKNQLINTAEYRYTFLKPRPVGLGFFRIYFGLQLAGFADVGHAWNESGEFALNRFIGGYGLGLRILAPFIDEIRVDVAFGEPGEGATFHFGLYPKVLMQRARVR